MSSLTIIIEGVRPTSKKNNLRPRKGGGFYTDAKVAPYEIALQAQAMVAMQAQGYEPTPDKTFIMRVRLGVKSYRSIDADNAVTTILDALQGLCYTNDCYCMDLRVSKYLLGKKQTWRTEINIEEVD